MQAFPLLVNVMSPRVGAEERLLACLAVVLLELVRHMKVNGVFQVTNGFWYLVKGVVSVADHMFMTIQIKIELKLLQERQIV